MADPTKPEMGSYEWCAALVEACQKRGRDSRHDIIRAAIEEARREEREACAELASSFGARPQTGDPIDTGRIWRASAAQNIAAAILARAKGGDRG